MPMHTSLRDGAEKNIEYGEIAQLVEQGTENPRVSGSIPLQATKQIYTEKLIFFSSI